MSKNQTSTSDVSVFLAKAKNLMMTGKYVFIPRGRNMQALASRGMTLADAKSEILGLLVKDYYKGPKQDFDLSQPGDVWEFKKDVDGEKFYVKLKIQNCNGEDILKCLSFHEDDYSWERGGECDDEIL